MNILWIVNIVFPEAKALLEGQGTLRSSGGWLVSAAEELAKGADVNLSVISVSSNVKEMKTLKGEKMDYYIVPFCRNPKKYSSYFIGLNNKLKPDVVHVHGTEYPYGWAWLQTLPTNNVVVSIQGLVGVIAKYYLAGLSRKQIILNLTLKDIFRHSILGEQSDFYRRGIIEMQVIKKARYVIGRTSFDKAHCLAINKDINYYVCDEVLRPEFYDGQWSYDKCVPHSIFVSQATYPIKGLHIVLYAMPFILQRFPDATLRIAGIDITNRTDIGSKIRYTGYGKIISGLIKKLGLQGKVVFTGALDSNGMKKEYLSSNIFISPSAIENSPNSVGEAQILGVPVVASYVGGVMDMMKGDEDNLYRFEEIEMLSQKICAIFDRRGEVPQLSLMREKARIRHDAKRNIVSLMQIYKNIVKQ